MRNILLIYQNTSAWNGLSEEEDAFAFMHVAGDFVEERSATGEWIGREEKG